MVHLARHWPGEPGYVGRWQLPGESAGSYDSARLTAPAMLAPADSAQDALST